MSRKIGKDGTFRPVERIYRVKGGRVVELEAEYTLHAIQRCPVLAVLPDMVELEIYSDEQF